MADRTSRISGFYRLPVERRRALLGLAREELDILATGGLDVDTADHMIENVLGVFALPFAVALNFRVNDRDHIVPMVIEEPSVVAAASNAARLARAGGGFHVDLDPPVMVAQVQLVDVPDPDAAAERIDAARADILALAATELAGLCARGGGPHGLACRVLSRPGDPDGGMLVVHVEIDCRDAMGANLVNRVAEAVAGRLAALARGRAGLRILTNLSDRRCARVRTRVPVDALGGADVADGIAAASRFAELDPYRAATHNKGIMNGVDAVLVATGNDWRGVEAGAHAFAARTGRYLPLATWRRAGDALDGRLELPMAVGTVGGALRCHAGARLALELSGATSAAELGALAAAAGLASNLAALRALATEGIQRGHMSLHHRATPRATVPTEVVK